MEVSEFAALGGLVIAIVVAAISAWSVVSAARRQADAAIAAARHQTQVNADLALFQIQATLSFTSKQQWIDTLRAELADLYSELLVVHAVVQKKVHAEPHSAVERIKRASHLTARISLLLDSNQPLHNDLFAALAEPFKNMEHIDGETFAAQASTLMKMGQLVIKHELEQLQRLAEFSAREEFKPSDAPVAPRRVRG